MRVALALAAKDLRLLLRDRIALFWTLGFPVLFALLMSAVLDGTSARDAAPLDLAVVDEDASAVSEHVVEVLRAFDAVTAREAKLDDAERDVRAGALAAVVRVPEGFGAALSGPAPVALELRVDPSRKVDALLLRGVLVEVVRALQAGPDDRPPRLVEVRAIAIATGARARRAGLEIVLPAAIVWALMGCAATFAVSLVSERTSGTWLRLLSAPVAPVTLFAGKALAAFAACVAAAGALLAIGRLAFGVPIERPGHLALALGSAALCFVGITVLLGSLGRTAQAVHGAGWATLLLLAMLGGAMVPLSAMPATLRALSVASPVRWAIFALEGATWRGLPLAAIAPWCARLVAAGVVALAVGVRAQRPSP